ncbi:MAG: histidine kinase [Gallionellaceae bacterium]|nr:histidine kinase [Gallionellaceae bacterium]
MQSINQNTPSDTLPNFRNLGVILKILLLVNGLGLLVVFAQASSWADITQRIVDFSALWQPALLLNLLLLYIFKPALARLAYPLGATAVIVLTMLGTLFIYYFGAAIYPDIEPGYFYLWRNTLIGGALAAMLLSYFKLRTQVLTPSLHAARLQALQARIRPHFLFNTINAVLGIVRADPKRAETALEDMADLFRMAMAHNSDLVAISHEITLAQQYLALEKLRLGDRLQIEWLTQDLPGDALIPPLMLQPLLENAVYHGIEPLTQGGTINIKLYREGKEIHLEVRNPRLEQANRRGNEIALTNIRERLALQFDVEAHYSVESGKNFYNVHIMLPYSKEEPR